MSVTVVLYVDRFGSVLIAITERRRSAETDIFGHSDWMTESTILETTEDRKVFIHRKLSLERSEASEDNRWLTDHNDDCILNWSDLMMNKESIFRIEVTTGNEYAH